MARQLLIPSFEYLKKKDFGGSLVKGNPREARPIALKRPLHLVLRSSLATGERSFLKPRHSKQIREAITRVARQKGVKVYRFANSGNHLHLVVQTPSRIAYNGFIRAISGLIARITLQTERGKAANLRFWDARPFTRILEWGRDYRQACAYVMQNTLEALGFVEYRPRGGKSEPRIKLRERPG